MRLSVTDRLRLAYSQVELWFGVTSIVVGGSMLTQADWDSMYLWLGPVATAPGRIVTTYPTSFEVSDHAVKGFTYRFPARGLEWAGTSFSSDSTLLPGQQADVEYSIAHPAVSRLKGTDSAPLGTTGLGVSLLFVVAGLGMSWRTAQQVRWLLAIVDDAATTQATYERTSVETGQDNEEKEYVLCYTYQVGQQRYTLRVKSPSALPCRKQELVVFQGANPANAKLLTSLPAFLQEKLVFLTYE